LDGDECGFFLYLYNYKGTGEPIPMQEEFIIRRTFAPNPDQTETDAGTQPASPESFEIPRSTKQLVSFMIGYYTVNFRELFYSV